MELPNVSKEIKEYFASQGKKYPVYSIWASRLGDPCERYIYESVVNWEKAKTIEPRVQGIFLLGAHLESLAAEFLKKTGWHVVEQLDTYVWKEKHISGRADRFVSREEIRKAPTEIKWLMGLKADTWQDLVKAEQRWIRRYTAQLLTYMLLRGSVLGLFLNCNKADAEPQHIWFDLEHDEELNQYSVTMLEKADRVWKAIESKKPAPRIDPGQGICLDCDFFLPCTPPIYFGEGVNQIQDPAFVKVLERLEELKPYSSEFDKLTNIKKKVLEKVPYATAGPFLIEGQKIHRKAYSVEASDYWKHTIKRIDLSEAKKELDSF